MRNPTSPQPLRAATAAVLLALPLLVSACGGGEDFAAEADGICTGEAVRVNSVLDDGGTPGSAAEAAAQNAQLLPIEREATSRLRGVEAPGGSAGAAYRDFLAARRHALRLSERRARAARRRAGAAYAALGNRRELAVREADSHATRAGLLACAERLSRAADRAVEGRDHQDRDEPRPGTLQRAVHRELRPRPVRSPRRVPSAPEAARGAPPARSRSATCAGSTASTRWRPSSPAAAIPGGQRMQLGMLYQDGAYRADSLTPKRRGHTLNHLRRLRRLTCLCRR